MDPHLPAQSQRTRPERRGWGIQGRQERAGHDRSHVQTVVLFKPCKTSPVARGRGLGAMQRILQGSPGREWATGLPSKTCAGGPRPAPGPLCARAPNAKGGLCPGGGDVGGWVPVAPRSATAWYDNHADALEEGPCPCVLLRLLCTCGGRLRRRGRGGRVGCQRTCAVSTPGRRTSSAVPGGSGPRALRATVGTKSMHSLEGNGNTLSSDRTTIG